MSRPAVRLCLPLLLLAAAPLAAAEKDDFFFKKGDRIVFLGDSITEQYQYSSYIELYLTTRFPDWNLTFINAGIGGDTAAGGAGRFAKHVLAEKPTCVTIDFGMNDGGYGGFNPDAAANYVKQTDAMLAAAKEAGARVALISPNAVDVRSKPGLKTYLETQQKFYAPLKDLAAGAQLPFVDQYAVTRAALEKIEADNGPAHPFPDGIHTNAAGGLLMAHTILVGLHAPAVVSDLEIDAAAKKVGKADRCTAAKVEGGADGVAFDRTDEAIPLPVQRDKDKNKDWGDVLPYVNQLSDLNYYGLKVTGLTGGKYTLSIDGKEVGTYAASDLAAGVNLGNLDAGPLFDQGQLVFKAITDKNNLVHDRFRGVVMYQPPAWLGLSPEQLEEKRAAELAKRTDQINAKQAEVYKLAQPAPHHFELKAAAK
jgi:lysophospholipase L1-like esterase